MTFPYYGLGPYSSVVHDVGYISLPTVYVFNSMDINPSMFGWWLRAGFLFDLFLSTRPSSFCFNKLSAVMSMTDFGHASHTFSE